MTSGRKVLSAEDLAKLRDLASDLIEHPEKVLDADRRGELADLLGMAVAFADDVLAEPAELPEWLQRDPQIRNRIIDELCRLWVEDGQRIPAALLPWVAIGFRELHALVQQAYRRKGTKGRARRDVHAVGRMMALLIEGQAWPPSEAARIIGKAAGIAPDSALREYRRYQAGEK